MPLTPKLREILDSVARDRAALLSAVEGLEEGALARAPEPGAWSVNDVLHHLALSAEASDKLLARMRDKAFETPPPADLTPEASVLDSIDGLVVQAEGRKARAPDRVQPRSAIAAEEAIARLEKAYAGMQEKVEALSPYDLTALTFPHPFFGELNLYQWLLVGAWHERRHTRQIERIRTAVETPGGES